MPFIRVTPYYSARDLFLNVDNIVSVEEVEDGNKKEDRTRITITSTNTPFVYVTGPASRVMEKILETYHHNAFAAQTAAIRRNG